MNAKFSKLVDQYSSWLRSKISIADVNGTCEITTPFLDRHNDRLQIYVQQSPSGFRLSDDGYIIGDLEASGCMLESPVRKKMLETILNGYGVGIKEDELFIECGEGDFPRKKHMLLQAMLTVNDLFFTSKHKVVSLFLEDVKRFLDESEVRYTENLSFTGKSGFLHKFDYVIPKSAKQPERIIKAINHPSKDSATSLMFAWIDTKETRPPNSQLFAIINDEDKKMGADVLASLGLYDIKPILWSNRTQSVPTLSA